MKYTAKTCVAVALLMLAGAGCESAEAKQCRAQYLATHALVPGIDVDNFESVEKGLEAVQQTTEVCRKANLREELEQLQKVRDQLQSHLDYLHTHGQPRELNADELAQLVEHGDPSCPNGQAYKPKQSEEQIRCTGPKLAFMNFEQARAFYSGRGFKIHAEDGQLKAEYGSESYTYHFASPNDENPARCIEVFAAPGISWQESVSRLTGVAPFRLKEGQPVKTPKGELALQHTKDDTQAIYRLGHCD